MTFRIFQVAVMLVALSICTPAIAQVMPSGGLQQKPLTQGETINIQWSDEMTAMTVDVLLWDGERRSYTPIANDVSSTGIRSIAWTIPGNFPQGEHYRFLIRDHRQVNRHLMSPSWVSIGSQNFGTPSPIQTETWPCIRVSPAPANEACTITWETGHASAFVIMDVTGQAVMSGTIGSGQQMARIETHTLRSGTYTVRIMCSGGLTLQGILYVFH